MFNLSSFLIMPSTTFSVIEYPPKLKKSSPICCPKYCDFLTSLLWSPSKSYLHSANGSNEISFFNTSKVLQGNNMCIKF